MTDVKNQVHSQKNKTPSTQISPIHTNSDRFRLYIVYTSKKRCVHTIDLNDCAICGHNLPEIKCTKTIIFSKFLKKVKGFRKTS